MKTKTPEPAENDQNSTYCEQCGCRITTGRCAHGVTPPQHTPGPWHIEKHGGRFEIWPVDHKHTHTYIGIVQTQTAVRLIAAAPDLLAALIALEQFTDHESRPLASDKLYAQARAAIAKAKGQP